MQVRDFGYLAGLEEELMPRFIPGLKLSGLFYREAVKPILDEYFPRLRYSAALIGWGSEVLGFDTALSSDHHWGPRVLLFLKKDEYQELSKPVKDILSTKLPYEFKGYSTNFSEPEPNGVRHPVAITAGPVNHLVNIYHLTDFVSARLGFDIEHAISVKDWLTFPQQRLLELTAGQVFHDGLGELNKMRRQLNYYPKDIWLYMLAAQWTRISQEEAFVGRAGNVGDELGSRIVAARIVRELIKLTFLMERQYTPYSKWLGSAFSKLKISKKLSSPLKRVLAAENWKKRERGLSECYSIVAFQHNALKITSAMATEVSNYFERPYKVIHAERFAEAIRKVIRDREVKAIRADLGSIDQFTDSTNVIEDQLLCKRLQVAYESLPNDHVRLPRKLLNQVQNNLKFP